MRERDRGERAPGARPSGLMATPHTRTAILPHEREETTERREKERRNVRRREGARKERQERGG